MSSSDQQMTLVGAVCRLLSCAMSLRLIVIGFERIGVKWSV